jgi:hypothetical protein
MENRSRSRTAEATHRNDRSNPKRCIFQSDRTALPFLPKRLDLAREAERWDSMPRRKPLASAPVRLPAAVAGYCRLAISLLGLGPLRSGGSDFRLVDIAANGIFGPVKQFDHCDNGGRSRWTKRWSRRIAQPDAGPWIHGPHVIASSALSWRLQVDTRFAKQTSEVPGLEIVSATLQALWALLFFSVLGGSTAFLRNTTDQHF